MTDPEKLAALAERAVQPFKVAGEEVSSAKIADAIDMLADLPPSFRTMQLASAFRLKSSVHAGQEALNRLFQRWRKMDLVRFGKGGRWSLAPGAWAKLQNAALRARALSKESDNANG